MKKYVRGTILAGQIITLAAFTYLTLNFFLRGYEYSAYGNMLGAATSNLLGFFCLIEVPFAILGILHSIRPHGKFKLWTLITSIVFDGAISYLILMGLYQTGRLTGSDAFSVIFVFTLFAAIALIIVGIVQGFKEINQYRAHLSQSLSPNRTLNPIDPNDVPSVVLPQPTLANGTTPETTKTVADLATLKRLYESQLISEEEYIQKKKEILARDFSQK